MCLAIAKPKGVEIAKKSFEMAFDNNDDGAGFAYASGGKIFIHKGFFTFDEFWSAYTPVRNKTMIIHFRWATSGKTDAANCHPFGICNGEYAIIHNGVINIDRRNNKDMSDTYHFSDLVLDPLFMALGFDHGAVKFVVEEAIGTGNKIVALRQDGKISIFNENQGHWDKGAWFSNSTYKFPKWRNNSSRDWRDKDWSQSSSVGTYVGREYAKEGRSQQLALPEGVTRGMPKDAKELLEETKEERASFPDYEPGIPNEYKEAWEEYLQTADETSASEEI